MTKDIGSMMKRKEDAKELRIEILEDVLLNLEKFINWDNMDDVERQYLQGFLAGVRSKVEKEKN